MKIDADYLGRALADLVSSRDAAKEKYHAYHGAVQIVERILVDLEKPDPPAGSPPKE